MMTSHLNSCVASSCDAQRLAHETRALGKPGVLELTAQIAGERLGDLVLVTGAGAIRLREVVRVRADFERRAGRWGACANASDADSIAAIQRQNPVGVTLLLPASIA